MTRFPRHAGLLEQLRARDRARMLGTARSLDFASNDYLGLRNSADLGRAVSDALARGVAVGAGASRLLRGNDPEIVALEAEAAAFFGVEASLFMGGGFQANQAIFATLPMAGDLVLHDALIHASAHEGMRLGAADQRAFCHNDPQDADDQIRIWRASGGAGRIWIALETVYSMDGDFAPVPDFIALARQHDAILVLDEAHATGLYGNLGRGLAPHAGDVAVIALHTCGKALGASGALICADQVVIDTLINRARPFIYATAPSPLMAAAVRAALRLLREQPGLRAHAAALRLHVQRMAGRLGFAHGGSQILPLPMGSDSAALQAAAQLQDAGFDLRAIRPPTVPKGTARLRISLTGGLQTPDIDALFGALADLRAGATP